MKKITVEPYNPLWPKLFENEARHIKKTLGTAIMALHHIGSTAVPGLSAKPIIDMLLVVNNPLTAIKPLESLGYIFKGELNLPGRFYFSKKSAPQCHLHVYGDLHHGEVALNLTFRDYLRTHCEAREAYETLKHSLLKSPTSFHKDHNHFSGYTLGKDGFIKDVLTRAGFCAPRITFATHDDEMHAVQKFFGAHPSKDLHHRYVLFYEGINILGAAKIDESKKIVAMEIDEKYTIPFLQILEKDVL